MKLTTMEADIISHRLEAEDAVVERFVEDGDGTEAGVAAAIESLARQVRERQVNPTTQMEKMVLADCINGSTYCGSIGDESVQLQSSVARVGKALAAKVQNITGIKCRFSLD